MLLSVVGTGYLGATHAACLAAAGHDVVAIDRDPERVALLSQGRAPFHEDGLDELLATGLASGRLRFTTEPASAAEAAVHFLCVGTPGVRGEEAGDAAERIDLTALWEALAELAPHLGGAALVVGRSTVPVGFTARARELLHRLAPAGSEASLAWNPEFLREGHAVADTQHPHRIVVGADRGRDARTLKEVYATWIDRGIPLFVTDPATAELAKLSANAMLATRVSTANVLAELCEGTGADLDDLVGIVGADPRIGTHYLAAGLGYGGSCLPKDVRGLAAVAEELGLDVPAAFLDTTELVNEHQRGRVAALAVDLLGGDARGRRVAALGVAFKPGSDDLRDSPALDVVQRLHAAGAEVVVHDPALADVPAPPGLVRAGSAEEACTEADLTMVLTDWPEYARLDPVSLAGRVAAPVAVDAWRTLDRPRWRNAGWDVWALGAADLRTALEEGSRAVPA